MRAQNLLLSYSCVLVSGVGQNMSQNNARGIVSKVFIGKILDGLFLKCPRKIPIKKMAIKLLGLILVHVSKLT